MSNRVALPLWYQAEQATQAQDWASKLAERGQAIDLILAAQPFTATWLRQYPALGLLLDESGLWLAGQGMKMQPDWLKQWPRLQRAGTRSELLLRACQLKPQQRALDATGGLGHDALILLSTGAAVTILERHPVVWALLQSNLSQMQPHWPGLCQRLTLVFADSSTYLQNLQTAQKRDELNFDLIYLDPMFPEAANPRKKAQVKKEMQLLHLLLQAEPQVTRQTEQQWLMKARQNARRVIIKRPRQAPFLADIQPDHSWYGEAVRFDGFFHASVSQLQP